MRRLEGLAPSNEELMEAAERADAGHKLAFPQLFDQSSAAARSTVATIDHESASAAGNELLDIKASIDKVALALPLEGQMDIHLALNVMGNEVEWLLALVSERWGE